MTSFGSGGLPPPSVIVDGGLRLDSFTLADAALHHAGEDAEMRLRFEAPRPATLAEHRMAIGRWIEGWGSGPTRTFAVRAADGVLIGGCEIRRHGARRADLSYWIYPQFRRRGYATRAVGLLCDWAAWIPGLEWLELHIDADNLASCNLARRLGFHRDGDVDDDDQTGATVRRRRYVRDLVSDYGQRV